MLALAASARCGIPAAACACTEDSHEALKRSSAWESLPLLGYQDDGRGGSLELRNCPCGSTLSKPAPSRVQIVKRGARKDAPQGGCRR